MAVLYQLRQSLCLRCLQALLASAWIEVPTAYVIVLSVKKDRIALSPMRFAAARFAGSLCRTSARYRYPLIGLSPIQQHMLKSTELPVKAGRDTLLPICSLETRPLVIRRIIYWNSAIIRFLEVSFAPLAGESGELRTNACNEPGEG